MKSFALKPLILIFFTLVFFSCSKEDDGIYFNETSEIINTNNVSYSAIENEILDLVTKPLCTESAEVCFTGD